MIDPITYGKPKPCKTMNMLERYLDEANTNSHQLAQQCNIDYYRLNRLEKMSQKDFELSCTIGELTEIQECLGII